LVDEVGSMIGGVFDLGESNVESMKVRSKFGEFSKNKKSVEEVVGGGKALGVGEDDDLGNAATDGGDDAVERGDMQRRGPNILSPEAQQIYDGVNEMKISDPERFNTLMEDFNPKPVKPHQYAPEVVKMCQDVVYEKYGPSKLTFTPVSVADLSEAACASEVEATMYTILANSSPKQCLWTITNPATHISEQSAEEGSRDSNGGTKKRKRHHAVEFKARKSPRFQESREVAPALLGNPLEAESHDKPMHDMINQEKAHDTTPSVQQVASPVSDHSMPEIPVGYMHSHNL
nr:hypothetical protein [Tanacetum cinerariifolium]